jgi:hypothetical protein
MMCCASPTHIDAGVAVVACAAVRARAHGLSHINGRYLRAVCCLHLEKFREAEECLVSSYPKAAAAARAHVCVHLLNNASDAAADRWRGDRRSERFVPAGQGLRGQRTTRGGEKEVLPQPPSRAPPLIGEMMWQIQ